MPPLVSAQVDEGAVALFREWIASLPPERKFVQEWSLADFPDDLDQVPDEYSAKNGKAHFKDAGCGQCHRFQDEIAGIGPNLAGVAARLKPREILESIINPSAKIADKYAATVLVTSDGRTFRGRIHSESADAVVLSSQEALTKPRTVLKSEIEERLLSNVSMMPKGTLNRFERREVLDLLCYLLSDGKVSDEPPAAE